MPGAELEWAAKILWSQRAWWSRAMPRSLLDNATLPTWSSYKKSGLDVNKTPGLSVLQVSYFPEQSPAQTPPSVMSYSPLLYDGEEKKERIMKSGKFMWGSVLFTAWGTAQGSSAPQQMKSDVLPQRITNVLLNFSSTSVRFPPHLNPAASSSWWPWFLFLLALCSSVFKNLILTASWRTGRQLLTLTLSLLPVSAG